MTTSAATALPAPGTVANPRRTRLHLVPAAVRPPASDHEAAVPVDPHPERGAATPSPEREQA